MTYGVRLQELRGTSSTWSCEASPVSAVRLRLLTRTQNACFPLPTCAIRDEWVETHAGHKYNMDVVGNAGHIDDIPDLDSNAPQEADSVAHDMAKLSVVGLKGAIYSDTPDLNDIPNMEEDDLEAGDEATAAPRPAALVDRAPETKYRIIPHVVVYNAHRLSSSQVVVANGNLLQYIRTM
jgi:hypothetical protein